MEIIKEIASNCNKIVIRTNTYKHTFEHISMLVDISKKDFPSLENRGIEVVQYAGERYNRTYGIEFYVTTDKTPEDYEVIERLESSF